MSKGRRLGRPSGGGRPLVSHCFDLDIRWLGRQGALIPGRSVSFSQTLNGHPRSSARVCADDDGLIVERHGQSAFVAFAYSAQHLGGRRRWFSCPCCDERAAVLYGWPLRCRRCAGLAYRSQRQTRRDRRLRRAQQFRERLGGSANMLEPFPARPKGMHWATYWRRQAVALQAEDRALVSMAAGLRAFAPRL